MPSLVPTEKTGTALVIPSWRFLLLLVWALWWGGIFFYAVVVVPIGSDAFGTVEQGFLTQRITRIHNAFSLLFLFLLLIEAIRLRSMSVGVILFTSAFNLLLMFIGHSQLTQAMHFEERVVSVAFYHQHAVYLWSFAAQWFQGILLPLLVLRAESARRSKSGTRICNSPN